MSDLLLDRILEMPRDRTAVSAIRDTSGDGWAHLTWAELRVAVRREAGAAGERGSSRAWARPRGTSQLVADLAMQFAGVVGRLGAASGGPADLTGPAATGPDDAGRLVRLRQDTRPRDLAVVTGGRTLDHAEVAEVAERLSRRLSPRQTLLPEVVFSTVDAATEQTLGWAAVWAALTLVCTEPGRLAQVDPTVWVCQPEQLAGALGGGRGGGRGAWGPRRTAPAPNLCRRWGSERRRAVPTTRGGGVDMDRVSRGGGALALEGMRVIDLSRLLPGPFATLCLQGLGATVVKVEDPNGGDYLRHLDPQVPIRPGTADTERVNAWFAALNRGKRSVCIDLKAPAGREALLALLASADVLVESFRPGVMARLGLDPVVLRARFPRLVIASLTGWGQTGPMAHLPGHDLGFLALAGLLYRSPSVPPIQWADLAAGGLAAALQIVAALLGRERSAGHFPGVWLDIAMLDNLVGLQQAVFAQLAAGAPPDEVLTGGVPVYDTYKVLDGFVTVAALEPAFLAALAARAPGLDRERLAAWLQGGTRAHWEEQLAGACVVPVLSPAEVLHHPHVLARGLFHEGLPHPPTGPVFGHPPRLGEHTTTELSA